MNGLTRKLTQLVPILGLMSVLLLGIWLGISSHPIAAGFAVGYVDTELAMKGHPKFAATQKAVTDYKTTRLKELDAYKGRTLTEAEKKQVLVKNETIAVEIDQKHDELFAPLANDVKKAVDATGTASGVEVILEAAAVHFGGIDLTPAVITELQKYK